MQFQTLAVATLFAAGALAAPVTNEAELALRGVCSTGFTIETFGSSDCGQFGQGDSNSGKGCNVCVQMGNAKSWKILNPDHCKTMSVAYYNGANCDGNIAQTQNYNFGVMSCEVIPNIGDHFSAKFVCLD